MSSGSLDRFALIGLIVATLLAAGGFAAYEWRRVVVTVQSEAPANAPVTDVELSVRGDSATIKQLARGQAVVLVPKPHGESGLVLQYKLGRRQCQWDGGYVEPTGGYRVVLTIRGCGDVLLRTTLWPR